MGGGGLSGRVNLVGMLGELIDEFRQLGDEVFVEVEQLPLEPVL
jgi:hypothetical protein